MSKGKGRISKLAVGRKGPVTGSGGSDALGADGSTISLIKQYTVSVDPASIAAVSQLDVAVTVTGITTDDVILSCEPQAALAADIGIIGFRVSAANTVTIRLRNNHATVAADQTAVNFKITAARILAADV